MLVLNEVTHADQGLYAIKLPSGFTYETVHLTVSGTNFFSYLFAIDVSNRQKSSSVNDKVLSTQWRESTKNKGAPLQRIVAIFCIIVACYIFWIIVKVCQNGTDLNDFIYNSFIYFKLTTITITTATIAVCVCVCIECNELSAFMYSLVMFCNG